MKDSNFKDFLDHAAWCSRCCFRDDFIKDYKHYVISNYDWEEGYANYVAKTTFERIESKGVIYAYQCSITSEEEVNALIYAYNIRRE